MVAASNQPIRNTVEKGQGAKTMPDVRSLAQGMYDGRLKIGPQPGPQSIFLSNPADIAVYGGAAGGGKTWALLLDPLRHATKNGAFSGVIFRRTFPMVRNEGGLWDESFQLYPMLGATPRASDFEWKFPTGATVRFAHMQHESNKLDWQGSQIPFMAFDELTHFSESQFMYVAFSRGRSMSGVRPYVRATCNPDASSWVKKFLAPWVDKTYPLQAASGEVLYMQRSGEGGEIVWKRGAEVPKYERDDYVSVTFVSASIFDNPLLLEKNPGYLALLRSLPPIDRQRLLEGDWDVVPSAGKVFNRMWANIVESVPERPTVTIVSSFGTKQQVDTVVDVTAPYRAVRFWDFASTEKELESDNPDFTVGCKMLRSGNIFTTLHIVRGQIAAGEIEELVYETAKADGYHVAIRWEIEGGSAGKILNASLIRKLTGFNAVGVRPEGSKLTRFKPVAQMAQTGAFQVMSAEWAEIYLNEMHHFPEKGWKKDQVDSTSGAYSFLANYSDPVIEGPDLFSDMPQTEGERELTAKTVMSARERLRRHKENEVEGWLE